MEKAKIRLVNLNDAERILQIYRPYVENTAITFEYTVPTLEEFKNRIASIVKKYPYIVAEIDGKIMGYAYANTFKNREAYDWSVETSIYVDENSRGKGLGLQLYRALENLLKKQGILNVNACITNPSKESKYVTKGSILFHGKLGYRHVGTFHNSGYKFDEWFDMSWMEKSLGEHNLKPGKVIEISKLLEKFTFEELMS